MLCTLREGIRLLSFRKRRMLKSTADVTAVLSEVEKNILQVHINTKELGLYMMKQEREAYRRNESAAEGFRSGRGYHIGASMTFLKLEET